MVLKVSEKQIPNVNMIKVWIQRRFNTEFRIKTCNRTSLLFILPGKESVLETSVLAGVCKTFLCSGKIVMHIYFDTNSGFA